MKSFIIALCITLILFNGCKNDDALIDKSKISINIYVFPNHYNQIGPTEYYASGSIKDQNHNDFSSAIVHINNVQLQVVNESNGYNSIYKDSIGTFNTGDNINLTITDNRLGSINIQETIPTSPTDFSLSPDLPIVDIENTSDTYSMTWQTVDDVETYLVGIVTVSGPTYPRTINSNGITISGTNYVFSTVDLTDINEEVFEWIGMYLGSVNKYTITGYSDGSSFFVGGCSTILKINCTYEIYP